MFNYFNKVMKKIILFAAILCGMGAAQAQSVGHVYGNKATDNWSFTLKGGAVSPFQHYAFFKNARGIFGAELRKQVTPVLGLGVEGEWTVNTTSWNDLRTPWTNGLGLKSQNMIDHQMVGGFATFNLSNLFGGYNGAPRCIDFEAVAGAGWLHGYQHGNGDNADENSWYTKYGMNINFNLGESNAWTISLKPAVLWDMNGDRDNNMVNRDIVRKDMKGGNTASTSRYNANNAMVEMQVGVTYHFGNSNGLHYMSMCPYQYTQADIDQLNGQINSLRNELSSAQADLSSCNSRAAQLARDLEACKAMKNKVVEVKENSESLETNVFFKQGKSVVERAQMPNVERVATFLKNHKGATVSIKGYASPEGSKEINEKLARNRANEVKNLLVKKYGIKASRIKAEGQGVGNMFSEPDWNRVSVCYIDKN